MDATPHCYTAHWLSSDLTPTIDAFITSKELRSEESSLFLTPFSSSFSPSALVCYQPINDSSPRELMRWPPPYPPTPYYFSQAETLSSSPPATDAVTGTSFLSPPFTQKTELTGTVVGKLYLEEIATLTATLYDRSPQGEQTKLSYASYEDGSLRFLPTSWIFFPGHALEVVFSSPLTIKTDLTHASHLVLPLDLPSPPLPEATTITDVTPRDGLQSLSSLLSTKDKEALIIALQQAGLKEIEVTSFVKKERVPQLADAEELLALFTDKSSFRALTPNLQGLSRARDTGISTVAIFTAVSETFCKKNINCTIEESFSKCEATIQQAHEWGLSVYGYLSCCLGCSYEGTVDPEKVLHYALRLYNMGCKRIMISDTTGMGTPRLVRYLFSLLLQHIPKEHLAVHFHGNPQQVLANAWEALLLGITHFDTSLGGFGGCPFAHAASSNTPSEELVALFEAHHVTTNVSLEGLLSAKRELFTALKKP